MSGVKRHPIRGFFAGLLLGLGVALLGVVTATIALGTIPPYICIVVGIVVGVAWAMFGPTRSRGGGGAPAMADASTSTSTESTSTESGE